MPQTHYDKETLARADKKLTSLLKLKETYKLTAHETVLSFVVLCYVKKTQREIVVALVPLLLVPLRGKKRTTTRNNKDQHQHKIILVIKEEEILFMIRMLEPRAPVTSWALDFESFHIVASSEMPQKYGKNEIWTFPGEFLTLPSSDPSTCLWSCVVIKYL